MTLKQPSTKTLAKYGLQLSDWEAIAQRQNYACYVCQKLPTTGRLCIDHEHVKGWAKMPDDQRKLYVRALLCHWCNRA